MSRWRSNGWIAFGAIAIVMSTALSTAGCGSKEETSSKSHRSDDDDAPSTRSASSSDIGTPMGTSARRRDHDRDAQRDLEGRSRRRDDDDPRGKREKRGVLASLTDLVGGLLPKNPFAAKSSSGSDIEEAADAACKCPDQACVDAVMKRFDKKDNRKIDDLTPDERKAVERLVDCSLKLTSGTPKSEPPRKTAPTNPAEAW